MCGIERTVLNMAGYVGFPVGYQNMYPQQFGNNIYQPATPNVPQAQQLMTPPTIHAEIVQVSSKDEATNFPVGAGQSQMMMMRDDSAIFIKTVYANGQASLLEYVKSLPKAESPPDYVTRQELEERLAEITKPKTTKKKEVTTNESDI